MDTSILSQELEPLKAQIEETQGELKELEDALGGVEAELDTFSIDQQRFDALQEACNALDKLAQLEAGELFWEGLPEVKDLSGHLALIRQRIVQFDEGIRGTRERKESIKAQIEQCLDELHDLQEEVNLAHEREERRQEEFVIEREVSAVPFRAALMPWARDGDSDKAFRRALAIAMLWSIFFGTVIPIIRVPLPDREVVVEIPKRLATLVKKEPPKPEPAVVREIKKPAKPEKEEKQLASKTKKASKEHKPVEKEQPKVAAASPQGGGKKASMGGGKEAARKKAESTGVLAFKSSFSDLMDKTPVARLGMEAHLSKAPPRAPGQAQAYRSLVAMEGKGGSGGIAGIGNGGFSRNAGLGGRGGGNGIGIGGVGVERVESSVAGLVEEKGRPISDGPGPGRTDEEIQIVFDRYKATLYRIYNTELRKDPTLRGKILLRITIEPDGELSLCKVESTDLASRELVAKIVARVKRFNFGPKEDVPKTTILYPIDFLPAG